MNIRSRFIHCCGALFLLLSCQSGGQTSRGILDGIALDFPRVDGSTSAMPLQRKLACDVFRIPWTWSENRERNVERNIIPDAAKNPSAAATEKVLKLKHTGTNSAYLNLVDGKTDLILAARAPSPDELAAAAKAGVVIDARPVANDAFAFLAHADNPVATITLDQARAVYNGKLSHWSELGVTINKQHAGPEPIKAYQRERNSGSQELMDALVMKSLPMITAPNMIRTTMLGPFNAIGGDRFTGEGGDVYGFCYTVYYYAAYMFPHAKVKMIAVGGVLPDAAAIASKRYPLVAEVYVALRSGMDPESSAVRYRDWMLTVEGQQAISESGYVRIK